MDENFLLHRKRALRLLELMEENDKAWALYVFSSANVLRSYTIDQLVRLGVSWVWMGIEGCNSQYVKLQGIDTFELVRELQSHGIRILGSTIIGLEDHTPENIDEAIEHAARHDTDFHQFMLYTPIPGTPLHAELTAKGVMKDPADFNPGDIHGQSIFSYRHPHIPAGMESEFMVRAFNRDFRAKRAQHDADRPHDAGGLETLQEPSGRSRPPPLCLGGPRVGDGLLRRGRRGETLLPPQSGDTGEDGRLGQGVERGVRLEVAADVARWRARMSTGSCGEKRSGWRRAGPTSRQPSTRRTPPATMTRPPIVATSPRMSLRKRRRRREGRISWRKSEKLFQDQIAAA